MLMISVVKPVRGLLDTLIRARTQVINRQCAIEEPSSRVIGEKGPRTPSYNDTDR